jgi:hypothetical protein
MAESITCPRCGATSYHPVDIREGYCAHCSDWTSPPHHHRCIWCGTDCHLNLPHRPDCPQTTGLYPVEDHLIGGRCCNDTCDYHFTAGDVYVHHPLNDTGDIVEVWCLGCAANTILDP